MMAPSPVGMAPEDPFAELIEAAYRVFARPRPDVIGV
jgi:hypothetical protein